MSWVPPDLSSACAVYNTLTTCQSSTFLFLQLIVNLFGRSRDDVSFKNSPDSDFGFESDKFSTFFEKDIFHENFFDDDVDLVDDFHEKPEAEVYDFIVVGAGSAGCVVANRLSEIPKWKVLLLEAGEEEPYVAEVPGLAPALQKSSIDWGFFTQPQPNSCLARRNGQCSWPRGKVMGGSSTINYLIYIRGGPKDYNEWAALGNHGWSYKEVLPYFRKSEHNANPDRIDPYFHGVGGYLNVETFPYQDRNVWALLNAYKELGLEEFDQNTDRQIGTMLMQHTTRNGERMSTNAAFIRPIRRKRRNLTVKTEAFGVRVLIDPHTKHAYGVEYVKNNKVIQVLARKEVILSAGALYSPKILMLSGIGPSRHLNSFDIEVLQDLKVGYNLQDHVTIDGVLFALTNASATTASDEQLESDAYLFKETQRGPLSATGTVQVNAFVQTKYEDNLDRPDIQLSIDSADVDDFISDPILAAETTVLPLSYYDGIMARPILLNPKSRGIVMLNATDPIYGLPSVHPNTFTENIDLLRMVEGVKQSLNLLKTHSFQKLGVNLVDVPWPACRSHRFGSDAYWACIATSYTTTIFHPVGTCKMGPPNDPTAVVDPELKVYGIRHLRVIDASIMPLIVRGNTNAPTIMIGEKGSDLIKKDWLHKYNFKKVRHSDFDFRKK